MNNRVNPSVDFRGDNAANLLHCTNIESGQRFVAASVARDMPNIAPRFIVRWRRADLVRDQAHACIATAEERARVRPHVRGPLPDLRGFERARAERRPRRRAARRARARAGSTDSWCRAPTASRTSICRRARSGWPGSPASPARPAPPSCWPSRRRCSSTGATRCRRPPRSTARCSPSSIWWRTRPTQWLEQNLKAGGKLGYDPWLHTSEGAEKLRQACATAGAELVAVERQSDRRALARAPGPARRPVTLHDIKFAGESAADKLTRVRGRARQAARRRAGGVRSAERRLGLQHPRLRHRAYAAGARLRHHPARGPAGALCRGRPSSTMACARRSARSPSCARPRTLDARPRHPQGQDRAARPRQRGGRADAADRGQRRQAGARAPIRSR